MTIFTTDDLPEKYEDMAIDVYRDNQTADLIQDATERATKKMAEERERVLVNAILAGFDGVDFIPNQMCCSNEEIFKFGFDVERWEGDPPSHDRGQRYDFRYFSQDTLEHVAIHGELPEELQ